MTTLLKNTTDLENFLNTEIVRKTFSYENKKPFKFSHANRSELSNLSSAVEMDLKSDEVFEEVKQEIESPELKFAPQAGTIRNMDRLMRRFHDLGNSFKTQAAKAKVFIEDQKYRVEDAYQDLKDKLNEHFKVKSLFQIQVND